MSLIIALRWYFILHWRRYLAASLLLMLVAGLNLVAPWLVGSLVDQIVAGNLDLERLNQTVLLLLITGISIYVLRYLWRLMLYSASYHLGSLLRQRLFQHWLSQPPIFFNRFTSGDLMARATNDVSAVEMFAGEAVLALIDGVVVGVLVLGIMFFAIDWRLAALALLPWPLMAYGFWKITRQLHHDFTLAQQQFSDLNAQALEQVSGLRLLRAYGLERRASELFASAAQQAQQANLKVAEVEARYEPLIFLTMGASFLIALGVGAWLVHNNSISIGDLTRFTLYLGMLIWPMFAYGWLLNLMERGSVAYQRIEDQLQTPPAILFKPVTSEDAAILDKAPDISWQISAFYYPQQTVPALQDFSGQLAFGKSLGIVGETAAGKSTFAQLLGRLYESDTFNIHIAGQPISSLSREQLRSLIAFVPQESFLFSTTIADNIALGKPNATAAEIQQAAKWAVIDDDIAGFPQGYETPVGEKGVTLSGGQKQRIAIARVMLMAAPIVVLDDALSAVDILTEKKILENLQAALQQRSTIIISHRLSAVKQADEIVVLQQGQVIERGNHKQLMQQERWYADIYHYQQLEKLVEAGQ